MRTGQAQIDIPEPHRVVPRFSAGWFNGGVRRKRWVGGALATGVLGVGVLGVAAAGAAYAGTRLLHRQAAIARAMIGKPLGEDAPDADKTYKKRYGDPVQLVLLGDSIAAGLGAELPGETLGARLAKGVAKKAHRSVRLRTAAVVGSESRALSRQLDSLPSGYRPDVAVIVIGGNDVTHRLPVSESVSHLAACVVALQERGAEVVVGTCPDLGALKPVPQPLRALGSRASRQLAAAQKQAALGLGARAVSLATVVGPFFITNPEEMFSLDLFHPSSLGYRRTAKAMLPSVLAAVGVEAELPHGHHAPHP
jgi:lysophospholipase L1-like esterase